MEWHTFALDRFPLLVRYDFSNTSSNLILLSVKMLNLKIYSSQSFKQANLLLDPQVSTTSLECLVIFNLDSCIDISSNYARLN